MARRTLRLERPGKAPRRAPLDELTVQLLREAARSVRSRMNAKGGHEVYVALLEQATDHGAEHSYYVGSTSIGSNARYAQHEQGIMSPKKWIQRSGIGLLPQLTAHLNPMLWIDAVIVEDQVHRALATAGFVVRGDLLAKPMLGSMFDEALAYAIRVHRRQVRKSTAIPYISHLMAVCSLVLEDGGMEADAIAALVHDAVEDQGGLRRLADIERRFGTDVAQLVEGLSDAAPAPGEEKAPWRQRKEAYLERLEDEPISVLRISLADKLHNIRSIASDHQQIGDEVFARFNASKSDLAWYYNRLADVFADRMTDSWNWPAYDAAVREIFPRTTKGRAANRGGDDFRG